MVEQLFLWQAEQNKDSGDGDHFNSGKAADTSMASERFCQGQWEKSFREGF